MAFRLGRLKGDIRSHQGESQRAVRTQRNTEVWAKRGGGAGGLLVAVCVCCTNMFLWVLGGIMLAALPCCAVGFVLV